MAEDIRVMHPGTEKMIRVVRRKYKLKMKSGTKGTIEDPHRPEIADFLVDKAARWSVHEGEGTIQIDCSEDTHVIVRQTHTPHNG